MTFKSIKDGNNLELTCQKMGLKGFQKVAAFDECSFAIRALFRPSFHPTSCVTVYKIGAEARLAFVGVVRAPSRQLQTTCQFSLCSSAHDLNVEEFEFIESLATKLLQLGTMAKRMLICDGMPTSFFIKNDDISSVVESNVSGGIGTARAMAELLLEMCWKKIEDAHCCELIEIIAPYIDLKFVPKRTIPHSLSISTTAFDTFVDLDSLNPDNLTKRVIITGL